MPSSTGTSCVLSCRWPAVSTTASGRPRPSAARCSLVVKPPRLRPSASSAATTSPFFRGGRRLGLRRRVARPRRVLVGADDGAVNRDHRPHHRALGLGFALQGLEHPLPDALAPPAEQAIVAGFPLPIPLRQIPPGGPGA